MKKYFAVFRASLMERAAYRFDLLGRAGMLLIFLFVLSRLWQKVHAAGADMAGLDGAALVWYLLITEGAMLATPALGAKIDAEVKRGDFAAWLLRPAHYLLFHLAGFLGEFSAGLLVNLSVGGVVAFLLAGPPPVTLPALAFILPALFAGALLNFCLLALIALAAFWVEDNEPFFWIHHKFLLILGGVLIPLEFFPGWLKTVASALPFADIFYGPARLFVRFDLPLAARLVLSQAGWCLGLGILLALVYRGGVKRVNLNGG